MEQLQITRNINQQVCQFFLTEVELEAAYRLMQRRYLDEDFANTLCNEAQNPDCRFHTGHLEEFPELTTWLCEYFDHFFDANMAHNDLLELTINHLQHASLTPAFFTELARLAPAFCEGTEKSVAHCEENCLRYHRCSNIAQADDRSKRCELLASLLTMHEHGTCSCSAKDAAPCEASRYLSGEWDIHDFFSCVTEG